jgi:hypothetical protein
MSNFCPGLSLIFVNKAGAYQCEAPYRIPLKGIGLEWKWPLVANALAYGSVN